jgi:hypothetical protein
MSAKLRKMANPGGLLVVTATTAAAIVLTYLGVMFAVHGRGGGDDGGGFLDVEKWPLFLAGGSYVLLVLLVLDSAKRRK